MSKRLLITGGTGFFGRALLRQLHAEAASNPTGQPAVFDEVVVVSRNPQGFAQRFPSLAVAPWLQWVRADVNDAQTLTALNVFSAIDCVLHAATDSTDAAGLTALQQFDQIVRGTRNVLDAAVRLKARRFLLTSSGGVYGPQPADLERIPETWCGMPDPLKIGSTYGIAKRAAEHLCFLYGQQGPLETVIARCFAFVGQDLPRDAHFAIGNFMRDAMSKPHVDVQGDGLAIRSYMCQTDLARWLFELLLRGRNAEAYNVGSDQGISIGELAALIVDVLSPGKTVHIHGKSLADNPQRNRYVPSIAKARQELGLDINRGLRDAIAHAGRD